MSSVSDIVLTADAMRSADEATISDFGVPGFTLMESAGRAAADRIEQRYGPAADRRVAVVCGRGNNGGDGLVVARVLHARGADVTVVMADGSARLSPDAGHNFRLLKALAEVQPLRFRMVDSKDRLGDFDWFIDALLGTGLASAPRAPMDAWIEWLNGRRGAVIALDMPSGLESDRGATPGGVVRADLTVTMGAWKCGLLLGDGPGTAGAVDVVEIGIPSHILEEAAALSGCARRTTDEQVRTWLRNRPAAQHKFSTGPTLVVGGSRQYPGAPIMAATAAARIGSGYVYCAGPESARESIAARLVEIPFVGFDPAADASAEVDSALSRARSVVIGPGMGRGKIVTTFVNDLLDRVVVPVVVDADGLHALAASGAQIADRSKGRWVLTPHAGEFARLSGQELDAGSSPVAQATTWAKRWNVVLVLKGMPSIVAAPDGRAMICSTGSEALTTAGTGDVLAGFCAGLLATGLEPFEAATAALHIGGAAADAFIHRSGRRSMMATDLIRQVGQVIKNRFE